MLLLRLYQQPTAILALILALFCTFLLGVMVGPTHHTAAQSSSLVTSTLLPRFINLSPVTALADANARYTLGGGPNISGMAMFKTGFSRFETGFTLPPDYASGTDITLRIMWANTNFDTNCEFTLWNNDVIVYRPNVTDWAAIPDGRFPNNSDTIQLSAGPTHQLVRLTPLTIKGTDPSRGPLQPGDAVQILIARRSTDASDTCTNSLIITGLDATYQGLSSYLPLAQN